MENQQKNIGQGEIVEFYQGDAAKLGEYESVGYLIKVAAANILRNTDNELQPYGLTAPQWAPLLVISKGKADTVAGCARAIDVDTGAMTRMLDRLEAKGLVSRNRSHKDRRIVHVELTKAGHEIVKLIPPSICLVLNRHLVGFSRAEFETLKDLLRRFVKNGHRKVDAL
ncbi:MAG: MarR family transcriptional regulator [Pseudomonadota bacterium]|nr:MarR family transcriptional regulator [Pseudomonadota bacterium]